jgi:16S rRNA (cytosine1402-N4)-methyltransferase
MTPRRRSDRRSPSLEAPLAGAPEEARGFHEPVLADETLGYLAPQGTGLYLDGTVGGGGHALRILGACPDCRLIAVDRDPEALAQAAATLAEHTGRVRFIESRFDEVAQDAEVQSTGLAGALLDLGVSSHQLDRIERGFQFGRGAPLDMRMAAQGPEANAAELLNDASEEELTEVFRDFGEERRARRLAREIVRRRASRPFETSDDLVGALSATLGRSPSNRDKARIFQAVRIAVNQELEVLARALPELRDVLRPSGTMVVIAYHSLEDRLVKEAFREWSSDCVCPPELPVCRCRGRALGETLTKRPVRAGEEELQRNPRSRSALLRAWRKAA